MDSLSLRTLLGVILNSIGVFVRNERCSALDAQRAGGPQAHTFCSKSFLPAGAR